MRIAVLPFSAGEGVQPALGRQIANFVSDTLRSATEADINTLNFMAPIQDQPGRADFVNLGDSLIDQAQMAPLFDQFQVDLVLDGILRMSENAFELTTRFTRKENKDEPKTEETSFNKAEIFQILDSLVKRLATEAALPLPSELADGMIGFGTDDPDALLKFLEGYDAFVYIRQANGMVSQNFDPEPSLNLLLESVQIDPNFEGAYEAVLEVARLAAQYRIGKFVALEGALEKLAAIVPQDFRAWYVLADIHMSIGESAEAAVYYEKALEVAPDEAALYTRLGICQLNQGMPVNAERNFRKAIEREGEDKPTLDYLATVLQQTGRAHEVPGLWKERLDLIPMNPLLHAKYGYSLIQAGRQEEGEKAFEEALAVLDNTVPIKRFYAPLLVEKEELDRAMDFYEDCLDSMPTDVPLMMEYARTLEKAGRDFEIPPVMRNILAANPEPNTKAQALGWLIELEQPKRAEAVEEASRKAEQGDFEGAVRELKPLKNWLGEYWKLWAVLAQCHNQLGEFAEAEDAAGRLVNIMPGYEPAYGELMQALAGQGKHEQAYNAMKWAAMNMPQSLPIHLNFGLAAKQAGHVDEARALAKQIREALGVNDQIEPVLAEIES